MGSAKWQCSGVRGVHYLPFVKQFVRGVDGPDPLYQLHPTSTLLSLTHRPPPVLQGQALKDYPTDFDLDPTRKDVEINTETINGPKVVVFFCQSSFDRFKCIFFSFHILWIRLTLRTNYKWNLVTIPSLHQSMWLMSFILIEKDGSHHEHCFYQWWIIKYKVWPKSFNISSSRNRDEWHQYRTTVGGFSFKSTRNCTGLTLSFNRFSISSFFCCLALLELI